MKNSIFNNLKKKITKSDLFITQPVIEYLFKRGNLRW